ncbi:hypothetical protein P4H71_01580 [Paenibacillus kribbensis]|uniref:hypothetical protein n=1 Tax=Paenibacillus kribbensis TaxID=172713 RepID=UPI002DBE88ED|nr:hypothetical protein [Paenibacillus kribbensis]MEC0233048.1 hypothetical protein [Paenibacillus kribbensis]
MIFNFNVGDTTFIALVNANQYQSFIDEDWTLPMLKEHFLKQTREKHILVFQMTQQGIEADWNIQLSLADEREDDLWLKKDIGYIQVDNQELHLVEYTCLTMAAQFEDEQVPDSYCSKFSYPIDNGLYKVNIIQFYDVDTNQRLGSENVDLQIVFTKVDHFEIREPKIYWWG